MTTQATLFDETPVRADNRFLFFALMPDGQTAHEISELTGTLQGHHHLGGTPRPTDHLHMTLNSLGPWSDRLIRAAERIGIATGGQVAPFEVCLEQAAFWSSNGVLVLVEGEDGSPALKAFQRRLCLEIARELGPEAVDPQFAPHVTMLYGRRAMPQTKVPPIRWIASEFVLICSHRGDTWYEVMGRWPLLG